MIYIYDIYILKFFHLHLSIQNQGDCHIKGGYVFGAKTFTVKLACVSFYKNVTERGLVSKNIESLVMLL
jgi:hypothetical protein